MEKRHLVHARSQMRDQGAHPFAAGSVLPPFPRALHDGTGIALEEFNLAPWIELFATLLNHQRLVVERIHLTGGTGHEELHDALGFGSMVQAAIQIWTRFQIKCVRQQSRTSEEMGQSNTTQASSPVPEKLATV